MAAKMYNESWHSSIDATRLDVFTDASEKGVERQHMKRRKKEQDDIDLGDAVYVKKRIITRAVVNPNL
jgi:hypothetical protein